MKYILITLFLLSCLLTEAQQELRNFGIAEVFRGGDSIFIKKLVTQVVNVSDGVTTKMRTPPDTAKLFIAPDNGIYEGVITWKKVGGVVIPPVPSVLGSIDNVDARNKYTGDWTTFNHLAFHNSTSTYTLVNGIVEVTFIGKKIEWWTEKAVNHGIVGLSIDGGAETTVDLYANTTVNNSQKVWTSTDLSAGQHKLKIRFTGNMNVLATQPNFIHDRVLVTQ